MVHPDNIQGTERLATDRSLTGKCPPDRVGGSRDAETSFYTEYKRCKIHKNTAILTPPDWL